MRLKALCIIPAYNEEESLAKTIEELQAKAPFVDFIVVNDGSSDGTEDVCRRHEYPFLDLPINLGLSGAFQAGMRYAYRYGYDCAIQFDADGQHCPEYLDALIRETENSDIVIGSRFVNEKKSLSMRMFGSFVIERAIQIVSRVDIKDPTSGMRAFNKRMIALFARELNFGPEPDTISYLIKSAGAKVSEIPVTMRDRYAGESYLNVKNSSLYMLRMALSILVIQPFRKTLKGVQE